MKVGLSDQTRVSFADMRRPYAFRIALGSVLPPNESSYGSDSHCCGIRPAPTPLRCGVRARTPFRRACTSAQARRNPPTAQQKSTPTAPQKLPAKVSPPGTPLADARGCADGLTPPHSARRRLPPRNPHRKASRSAVLGLCPSDLRHTPQIRRSQANGGASPRPIPNSAEISSLSTKQTAKKRKYWVFQA